MVTMLIRPIEVRDAENFIDLLKIIDESGFMMYVPGERKITVEKQSNIIEGLLSEEKSIIFVAEAERKLAGYIAASGGNLKRNRHSAYLVLGVSEQHQGNGIATELFHHIFEWAKEVGISRLGLTVIKDNTKATHLYKKMGFILEGEKVHSLMINGEPVNEYYLYKLL
jgi:RimJ/RimL family protein N-acetyltransferase